MPDKAHHYHRGLWTLVACSRTTQLWILRNITDALLHGDLVVDGDSPRGPSRRTWIIRLTVGCIWINRLSGTGNDLWQSSVELQARLELSSKYYCDLAIKVNF